LTVTTTTGSAALIGKSTLWFPVSALAVLFCLSGGKRRRSFLLVLLAVSALSFTLLVGCVAPPGGGANSKSVASTITVTATAGSLQHATTFSLTVQTANTATASTVTQTKSDPLHPGGS
jgi:hypothetical protein